MSSQTPTKTRRARSERCVDAALLLRRSQYGETSLVVHVLTRSHGRVPLIAKGAYRPTSRFYCVLDQFDTLELEWSHSPRRELQILSKGALLERRRPLWQDLDRYRAACAALELCELAARPEHVDTQLFDALRDHLERLCAPQVRTELELARFELTFLACLGLSPALLTCASCGGPAPPTSQQLARATFSAGAGGRLCPRCAGEAHQAGKRVGTLPLETLAAAAELSGGAGLDGQETPRALPEPTVARVRDLTARFLAYQLQSEPRYLARLLHAPSPNAPGR